MLRQGHELITSLDSGNRFQVVLVDKGKGLGLNEAIKELYLDETYLTSREVMYPSSRSRTKY